MYSSLSLFQAKHTISLPEAVICRNPRQTKTLLDDDLACGDEKKKKKKDIWWEEEERNTSSGATGNKNVTFYGATRSEITSHLQSVGQGEIINFWGCTGLSCRFLSLLPCSLSPHGSCLLFQQEAGQVHSAADPSLWHSLHHVCFLP